MEHKDPAIKAEMLRNEIEMIKANMASPYAADRDDMAKELAVREKELDALTDAGAAPPSNGSGVLAFDDSAIGAETVRDDIADIQANIETVSARLAKTEDGPARAEYTRDLADLKAALAAREKDLAARLPP